MYKIIVYDLDGTLVDSATIVIQLLNQLRTERRLAPKPREEYLPLLSNRGPP